MVTKTQRWVKEIKEKVTVEMRRRGTLGERNAPGVTEKERERESEFPFSSASHENSLFIRASKLTRNVMTTSKGGGVNINRNIQRERWSVSVAKSKH